MQKVTWIDVALLLVIMVTLATMLLTGVRRAPSLQPRISPGIWWTSFASEAITTNYEGKKIGVDHQVVMVSHYGQKGDTFGLRKGFNGQMEIWVYRNGRCWMKAPTQCTGFDGLPAPVDGYMLFTKGNYLVTCYWNKEVKLRVPVSLPAST